jgi:hypothetical protein
MSYWPTKKPPVTLPDLSRKPDESIDRHASRLLNALYRASDDLELGKISKAEYKVISRDILQRLTVCRDIKLRMRNQTRRK